MAQTILTVDDSASIRRMIAFSLHEAGYEVIQAVDGADGYAKSQGAAIALVLTDQNMPNMDGCTLIRSLRALPAYQRIPMLLLTTEDGDDIKVRAREAGATGRLVKPFEPQQLLEVVRKLIG